MHEPDLPRHAGDDAARRSRGNWSWVDWAATLVTVICVVAARMLALDRFPPGFAVAEAHVGLAAQAIERDQLPLLPDATRADGDAPLFLWIVRLTGELAGWGVAGPRLAAALLGLLTVVACALWYRRALGPVWAAAGALLVGTSFWQLLYSRQAAPEVATAASAAVGLWCLWEGGTTSGRRGYAWFAGAGVACALGTYASPAGVIMLPVALTVGAVGALWAWRGATGHGGNRGRPLVALAALLLVAVPVLGQLIADPGSLPERLEQDWDHDGTPDQIRGPAASLTGYAITLRSLILMGYDAQAVNLPGRALLDPLLACWAALGLLVALRRPRERLHSVALLWLAGSLIAPALVAPGHPGLLQPATPALFLLPLLGMRAVHGPLVARGGRRARLVPVVVAASIVVTASWSLVDYFGRWAPAEATYRAYNGDVRDALAAIDQLPGQTPVYFAADPAAAPLAAYLAPARALHTLDSRTTLALPAAGGRLLVVSRAAALPPTLRRYLAGTEPIATGTAPDGAPAWQAWPVGQRVRELLPYTLPVIHFPHGFDLVGFDIVPDLGDVETTGRLPDPPRMRVTLVWRVPFGAEPLVARARVVPVSAPDAPELARSADVPLAPAPTTAGEPGTQELIIVELIVAVPPTPDQIVDVQAGLLAADGTLLAPLGPAVAISGDYGYLNRVQYVAE